MSKLVVWEIHPGFLRLDFLGKWQSGGSKHLPLIAFSAVEIIENALKYNAKPISEDLLISKREANSVSFSLLFQSNENMEQFLKTINPLY